MTIDHDTRHSYFMSKSDYISPTVGKKIVLKEGKKMEYLRTRLIPPPPSLPRLEKVPGRKGWANRNTWSPRAIQEAYLAAQSQQSK
jgi:hypothetical protein